jgi:hypothetical protein
MASVEVAMSMVARPGLIARMWHWRYELCLIAGVRTGWPYLDRGEAGGTESQEPALSYRPLA